MNIIIGQLLLSFDCYRQVSAAADRPARRSASLQTFRASLQYSAVRRCQRWVW